MTQSSSLYPRWPKTYMVHHDCSPIEPNIHSVEIFSWICLLGNLSKTGRATQRALACNNHWKPTAVVNLHRIRLSVWIFEPSRLSRWCVIIIFFSGITCKTPHDMIWLQVTSQNIIFFIVHCIESKSSMRFVLCCCCYKYLPDVYDFDILWGKVTYMYSCIHLSSEKSFFVRERVKKIDFFRKKS